TLAVVLLACFCLASSARLLLDPAPRQPTFRGQDEISQYDGPRFARLRPLLAGHRSAGYLGRPSTGPQSVGSKYYLTQYSLVPMSLTHGANAPFVVGDFHAPAYEPPDPPGRRLVLVADLGDGVRWYRTEPE